MSLYNTGPGRPDIFYSGDVVNNLVNVCPAWRTEVGKRFSWKQNTAIPGRLLTNAPTAAAEHFTVRVTVARPRRISAFPIAGTPVINRFSKRCVAVRVSIILTCRYNRVKRNVTCATHRSTWAAGRVFRDPNWAGAPRARNQSVFRNTSLVQIPTDPMPSPVIAA